MVYTIRKVSNYGTSNYIVARTAIQVNKLLQPISLDEKKKEKIFALFYLKIQPRLILCMEISDRINRDLESINNELKEKGTKTQSNGKIVEVPHVYKLQEDVETFLYNAKSVLRDLSGLFEIFFNKKFNHSRYHHILKWAKKKFGDKHPIPSLIEDNLTWLKDIVERRNAIEHPGNNSGYLHIRNIEFVDEINNPRFVAPTWYLNDYRPSLINCDLEIILRNLLEFSEILFILCLATIETMIPLRFFEIPEEERDKSMPVRFGVTIDINDLK